MIPAIIAAGASILGGVLANRSSAKQAAEANSMSLEQMNAQNQFNSAQAEVDFIRSRQNMHEANALNLSNMEAAHNYQRFQNLEQMQFQDSQANKQMAFQERLANSQHQREVNDLRLAGLNPVLSGTGGAGSAVAQGAMGTGHAGGPSAATVSAPGARGYGAGSASFQQARVQDVLGPAMSSAMAASRAVEEINLLKDQQQRTQAETIRTVAEGERTRSQADLDKAFAYAERKGGSEKLGWEADRALHQSGREQVEHNLDVQMREAERKAALKFMSNNASHMGATARSASEKARLDEKLSEYERLINMGEGATSALGNLLPKIRLWEGKNSKGKDISIGR